MKKSSGSLCFRYLNDRTKGCLCLVSVCPHYSANDLMGQTVNDKNYMIIYIFVFSLSGVIGFICQRLWIAFWSFGRINDRAFWQAFVVSFFIFTVHNLRRQRTCEHIQMQNCSDWHRYLAVHYLIFCPWSSKYQIFACYISSWGRDFSAHQVMQRSI